MRRGEPIRVKEAERQMYGESIRLMVRVTRHCPSNMLESWTFALSAGV